MNIPAIGHKSPRIALNASLAGPKTPALCKSWRVVPSPVSTADPLTDSAVMSSTKVLKNHMRKLKADLARPEEVGWREAPMQAKMLGVLAGHPGAEFWPEHPKTLGKCVNVPEMNQNESCGLPEGSTT